MQSQTQTPEEILECGHPEAQRPPRRVLRRHLVDRRARGRAPRDRGDGEQDEHRRQALLREIREQDALLPLRLLRPPTMACSVPGDLFSFPRTDARIWLRYSL